MKIFFQGILSYFVSILAKSLIILFQHNIESVYFFYSNPVYNQDTQRQKCPPEPFVANDIPAFAKDIIR
jgi:hypothetical protein